MLTILNQQPSLANHCLSELRDVQLQQDRERFRLNVLRLGELMAYEVSKKLSYHSRSVQTPLGISSVDLLSQEPVLVTVMRAGLAYFQGFQNYFKNADCGFIGAYRNEGTAELSIHLDYLAAPDLTNRVLILIDPMLATGKSFLKSVEALTRNGTPSFIHVAALVAAPQGIKYLNDQLKIPFHIWTWALDEKLDDKHYIVPGLGDAGDLSYGEKL
jgi:uracil phosphoribosyltransferase